MQQGLSNEPNFNVILQNWHFWLKWLATKFSTKRKIKLWSSWEAPKSYSNFLKFGREAIQMCLNQDKGGEQGFEKNSLFWAALDRLSWVLKKCIG